MKIFLCHNSKDSEFVIKIAKHFKRVFKDLFYYEDEHQESGRATKSFVNQINENLNKADLLIVFIGDEFSEWQNTEVTTFINQKNKNPNKKIFSVLLDENVNVPEKVSSLDTFPKYKIQDKTDDEALDLVKRITKNLGTSQSFLDGLPFDSNLAAYEKDTVDFFLEIIKHGDNIFNNTPKDNLQRKKFKEIKDKMLAGFPQRWPQVKHWKEIQYENRIPESKIGKYRPDAAHVVAASLTSMHECCLKTGNLTFPEAGPRKFLTFPKENNDLNVGILVSGGIAPGINSVIDGITQRHEMYANEHNYSVDIYGFKNGFHAFDNLKHSNIMLKGEITSEHVNEGGSILGTSRYSDLFQSSKRERTLERIVSQLYNWDISILYIIGGDGSMKAAHAIWKYAQEYAKDRDIQEKLSVIAVPKTMDNDILWVWQTFGFLSAVEKGRGIIEDLGIEVKSNPRIGVIQLFGSDSGFVVSHAVLASRTGICDVALIPEVDFSIEKLSKYIESRIQHRRDRIPKSLIVMAETAIPTDALEYLDDESIGLSEEEKQAIRKFDALRKKGLHIQGQTDDLLRNAGLKIVSKALLNKLPNERINDVDWSKKRAFTNEPRHLLRAITPSSSDIIFGNRLGTLAVDNALAGYTDFMISQWLTEYVLVPLDLVVLGRKRIPKSGVFWKSVLTKTGQDPDLNEYRPITRNHKK